MDKKRLVLIVLALVVVAGALVGGIFIGQANATNKTIVCPQAPVPFQLMVNKTATIDGQQTYVACAWVGGVPTDSPLVASLSQP